MYKDVSSAHKYLFFYPPIIFILLLFLALHRTAFQFKHQSSIFLFEVILCTTAIYTNREDELVLHMPGEAHDESVQGEGGGGYRWCE